jgi:uncharacterized protein (DUF697 family)
MTRPESLAANDVHREEAAVRAEMDEVRGVVASLDPAALRDGSWFPRLLRGTLQSSTRAAAEAGGVESLRRRFPGRGPEALAEALVEQAARRAGQAAAIVGASTASALVAAQAGASGVGASAAVADAAKAGAVELVYSARLQIELVYDLWAIHGFPLAPDDPDELLRVFATAYGVPMDLAAVAGGAKPKPPAPEVGRAGLRKVMYGHQAAVTKVALRYLGPKIGKKIAQRAILKTAVPVAGVGPSSSWSYASTAALGRVALASVRSRLALRAALARVSKDLAREPNHVGYVLEAVHRVATADHDFSERELELYDDVFAATGRNAGVRQNLEGRIGLPLVETERGLRSFASAELKASLAEVLELVAIADGVIDPDELATLVRLREALGQRVDVVGLERRAAQFRSSDGPVPRSAPSSPHAGSGVGPEARSARISPLAVTMPLAPPPSPQAAAGPAASPTAVAAPALGSPDAVGEEERRVEAIMKRLQQLIALHEGGLITDEDVRAQRARILSEL